MFAVSNSYLSFSFFAAEKIGFASRGNGGY